MSQQAPALAPSGGSSDDPFLSMMSFASGLGGGGGGGDGDDMMGVGNPDYVTVGESISVEEGFLRGHGTRLRNGQLVATVCGFVERVNKLVSVRPLQSRYQGNVGDVLVGRIVEVLDKKWKVDINSTQHGVLMLSAVHLPGGVQRRRTAEDSLQMHNFYTDNDLLSTEVQNLLSDGAISLHTRSPKKYRKLTGGVFVRVPAVLVRRCAQHFHTLPCGVEVILGNNGYIWIAEAKRGEADEDAAAPAAEEAASKVTDQAARQRIARVRNSIVALSKSGLPIFRESVVSVYDQSVSLGLEAKEIVKAENLFPVTQGVRVLLS